MIDQSIALPAGGLNPAYASPAISQLRQEYANRQSLFQAQPAQVQRYLEAQAAVLAEAIFQDLPQVSFSLPEHVRPSWETALVSISPKLRQQAVGKVLGRKDLRLQLRQLLLSLEQEDHLGIATSAALTRYAAAMSLVHSVLPAGRTVTYTTAEGDTIPTIPLRIGSGTPSTSPAANGATLESESGPDAHSELPVPYVEAARRFYLPQWVALDEQGRLLVNTLKEAEAYLTSMQRYLFILHAAIGLAPYMAADEDYQQKRYGMLGQLVNQGRVFARCQVHEIIQTIQRRAADQELNRGLHLSLPYFNDQTLTVEEYGFDVVPAGRILFVPAFVVRAAHEQQVKVAQDTRLSPATRRHLLTLLYLLGTAFYSPSGNRVNNQQG